MPCRRIFGAVHNDGIAVDHAGQAVERLGSGGRSRCTSKQEQCDEAGDEHQLGREIA